MTPERFAKLVKDDYDKWGRMMREANIKAD
jgi:tripartite-type tricarboxylate transporter receptor subunit TctC